MLLWRLFGAAFAMMEGINYVFNTMAPYIAVNMLVSVLGLFAMTLLYDAKVAKRIVAVVVFQVHSNCIGNFCKCYFFSCT